MARTSKAVLTDNFPKVKQASNEVVAAAREAALRAGAEEIKRKVSSLNSSRDYNLPETSAGFERSGTSSGTIFLGQPDEFWWRFFEYGTVYISAYPMVRPAAKVMNTTFEAIVLRSLHATIKRKATARKKH